MALRTMATPTSRMATKVKASAWGATKRAATKPDAQIRTKTDETTEAGKVRVGEAGVSTDMTVAQATHRTAEHKPHR
jgi:hypothetical protein